MGLRNGVDEGGVRVPVGMSEILAGMDEGYARAGDGFFQVLRQRGDGTCLVLIIQRILAELSERRSRSFGQARTGEGVKEGLGVVAQGQTVRRRPLSAVERQKGAEDDGENGAFPAPPWGYDGQGTSVQREEPWAGDDAVILETQ